MGIKKLSAALLTALAIVLLSPAIADAYAGLGGYISEKMIAGAAIDSLYINRGTSGPLVVASAPRISTLPATAVSFATPPAVATLNGNIANLNGMPTASYFFQWGYSAASLSNSTPVANTVSTGNFSATITGFVPQTIFYRFASGTDTYTYGAVSSFSITGSQAGKAAGLSLLWNVFLFIVAAGIVITTLALGIRYGAVWLIISSIIGIIGFAILYRVLVTMIFGG